MNRNRLFLVAALAVSTLGLASSAYAQVVFDNGNPFTGQSSGGLNITSTAVADDFVMSSSFTFDTIRFFVSDNTPGIADNFSGTLSWYILRDNGAARPGELVVSGVTSAVSVTDTGERLAGVPEFQVGQYDFSTGAQTLTAGTYWLRIAEGVPSSSSTDMSNLFWVTTTVTMEEQQGNMAVSSGNIVNPQADDYLPTGAQLAFQLRNTGQAVVAPEPSALVLFGTALPIVAAATLRHRRRHLLYGS